MVENPAPIFSEMQEKLEQPSCFGNWVKSAKCGMCWFWPVCKESKQDTKPAKRGRPSKKDAEAEIDLSKDESED